MIMGASSPSLPGRYGRARDCTMLAMLTRGSVRRATKSPTQSSTGGGSVLLAPPKGCGSHRKRRATGRCSLGSRVFCILVALLSTQTNGCPCPPKMFDSAFT
jgi:hypothetical protein